MVVLTINHIVGHGNLGIGKDLGEVAIALSHDPLSKTCQQAKDQKKGFSHTKNFRFGQI
jgi:hypothetical protein